MIKLFAASLILLSSICAADEYADIIYPVELTEKQKSALTSLTSWRWYAPKNPRELEEARTKRIEEWTTLGESLPKLSLPRLAVSGDIQVTEETITNKSDLDVLVVIAHETGIDIAHRTHWIKAGESIPNQSIFMDGVLPCHILWPKQEREQVADDQLPARAESKD